MMSTYNTSKVLMLPTCKSIEAFQTNSIVRIQASSNYCKVFFSNGKTLVVAKVLRWFEERLTGHEFVRVHRTHIVNSQYVIQYKKADASIQLLSGDFVAVSRRMKKTVNNSLLSEYCA